MKRNTPPTDLSLIDLQLSFEHWRKTRAVRESTPRRLKTMAVQLAAKEKRAAICKALAINSHAFKQWADAGSARALAAPATQFVALESENESLELTGPASDTTPRSTTITLPNGVQVKTTGAFSLSEQLSAANQVGFAQ